MSSPRHNASRLSECRIHNVGYTVRRLSAQQYQGTSMGAVTGEVDGWDLILPCRWSWDDPFRIFITMMISFLLRWDDPFWLPRAPRRPVRSAAETARASSVGQARLGDRSITGGSEYGTTVFSRGYVSGVLLLECERSFTRFVL